jgi:hypothetical protein
MKKVLAMGLGALLVAGSAGPASAASQIDFSGYYRAMFANDWNNGISDDEVSDSGFSNRLRLNFAFHPTDEISVFWRFHAPHNQRWGNSGDVRTVYSFGRIKQDWGTVTIGRLSDAHTYYGLDSLGWNWAGVDDTITDWGVFDPGGERDGISYSNRWDNGFQLVAQFLRLADVAKTNSERGSDDLFILEPSYHWEDGGASLGLRYERDHAGAHAHNPGGEDGPALKVFALNPALAQSFGDFSLHFEGLFAWGRVPVAGQDDMKASGYGLYLDGDYNYGPGNVTLAAWWASGTGSGDDQANNLVDMGLGNGFIPFVVAGGGNWSGTNAIALANERSAAIQDGARMDGGTSGNHWALALAGAHAFNDDLTLKYTVGYMALNKAASGAKKDIGWEADLGLAVNLLDNLEFRSTFGYLFAGDALRTYDDPLDHASASHSPQDAFSWYNTLYFRF